MGKSYLIAIRRQGIAWHRLSVAWQLCRVGTGLEDRPMLLKCREDWDAAGIKDANEAL
jgi:hypothetical protein